MRAVNARSPQGPQGLPGRDVASQPVAFEGLQVRVATPATLYRMMKGTVGPNDWGDAEALRRHFGVEEED